MPRFELRSPLSKRSIGAAVTCVLAALLAWPCGSLRAQTASPSTPPSAKELVNTMLLNEEEAAARRDRYTYLSRERSERTGGHLWTEKVAETPAGKVRFLIEVDGQPLSADRVAVERGRLAAILADPTAFEKKEEAMKNDENHSRQMLSLLPRGFLFSDPREEGGLLHIDYRPNPEFNPQSLEERVLHGMSGWMLIDQHAMRLRRVEGRLGQDVTLGFGLLATIRAGSNFATTREPVGTPGALEWKTTVIHTDIDGKAIFFKVIAKKEDAEHTNFVRVPNDLTLAQAVELVER